MNTKIMVVIAAAIIVVAGIGTYEILYSEGYVNPGITILSFSSNQDAYQNGSFEIPVFTANISSSVTAEYVLSFGSSPIERELTFSGPVTGKQNLLFPRTFSESIEEMSLIGSPGYHNVTLSLKYDHFRTSKTITIYTFPEVKVSAQHYHIDTGITDRFYASPKPPYALSWYANGNYIGDTNETSASFRQPGNYSISFAESYGQFRFNETPFNITVYPPPKATGISYSCYSYYFGLSSFTVYMNETGGDPGLFGLNYSIYVNGTLAAQIAGDGEEQDQLYASGSGPFSVYFKVSDPYYSSISASIEVP